MNSHLEDYAVAASYFHQLAPFYAQNEWSELEIAILGMYAKCLKRLSRTEEYVRITLKLLAKEVLLRDGVSSSKRATSVISTGATPKTSKGYLTDVVTVSKTFQEPIIVPMIGYFSKIQADTHILHDDDMDGFAINLSFQYLMLDSIESKDVKLRLISSTEGSNREIWLSAEVPIKIVFGYCKIALVSKV